MISETVKKELNRAAKLLNIEGYARIDAFVRLTNENKVEVVFIEVNSLPGMTPATCIFHQAAINHYKPFEFIEKIIEYGFKRKQLTIG
jgi:D-alanine-D-alanine ligase